jgi:SAM-dependent methyltransferase
MREYHGYLDRFSIIGCCVIAEGWANYRRLKLWYDDKPLPVSVAPVHRPDLIPIFGNGAEDWGFSLCAVLRSSDVDRRKFRLKFNNGMILTDPAQRFSRHDDHKFELMTRRFRESIIEKKTGSLLEIGSRARSGTTYRDWLPPNIEYVGMDITAGPNVDIVGDAHHLTRHINRKFDFIFSIAVFEHLLMPWKVAIEMNRILADGGLALVISHAAWPLHEEPWDFFRFSKESWSGLFNLYTGFAVLDAQYEHQASIVPFYIHNEHFEHMSQGPTYLLSGCLVQKTGDARVMWNAEAGEITNLRYSHA